MAYADGNIVIGTSVDVGGMNTGLYKIQKAMKRLGTIATVGLSAGLYKLSKAAINAASDLQEIQNVVDVAFKDMSYKIEEFSKVCIKAFGMSELSAKQTAGSFMAMGASIGITQEAASNMAVELTGLTGDFASFYNISQQYAKVALSAVYSGETETLKRYGIILTEANLQEYATTIGIEKKVKAMSAAEKTLLRYNYIMEATNNMHNDFERTQHSWANTMRVLQENWNALMAAMGAGLIKVFQPIVECLSVIVQKLLAIIKYVNELLGIMYETEDVEYAQEMEDVADALDDAGKAAKTMLAPFDKLNNITSSSTKSAKDDSKVLEDLYDRMGLVGYVIDKLKNLSVEVEEISEHTKQKLRELVTFFKKAVEKIKNIWNNIRLGNWFSVGKDLGGMISTLQNFLSDAIKGVNWTEVGTNVGRFFEGIIWSDALFGWVGVMTDALDAALDLAIAAIDQISMADIVKLSKNVSEAALKVLRWFRRVLQKVDWTDLGRKVGKFFAELDWGGFLKEAAGVIWDALVAVLSAYKGLLNVNPVATTFVTALGAAFGAAKLTGLTDSLTRTLKKKIIAWKKRDLKTEILPMFKKAIGGIAFATSILMTIGIKTELASGEKDFGLGAVLQEAVSAALLAAGLKLMGQPSGFAFTVGGVFLLVNLIYDFFAQPPEEEKAKRARADALEKLKNTSWFNEIEEPLDIIINLGFDVQTDTSNRQKADEYYQGIIDKWLELSSKADQLTSDERNLMYALSEEVKEYLPDITDNIDEITGAYTGTAEAIQLIMDKQKELLALEVYKGIIEEYTQAIIDATVAQDKAEQKLEGFKTKVTSKEYMATIAEYIDRHAYAQAGVTSDEEAALVDAQVKQVTENIDSYADQVVKALEEGQRKINIGGFDVNLTEVLFDWDDELADETLFDLGVAIDEVQKDIDAYTSAINTAIEQQQAYQIEQGKLEYSLKNSNVLVELSLLTDSFKQGFNLDEEWSGNVSAELLNVKKALDTGRDDEVQPAMKALFDTIETSLVNLPIDGKLKQDTFDAVDVIRTAVEEGGINPRTALTNLVDTLTETYKTTLEDNEDEDMKDPTQNAVDVIQQIVKGSQAKMFDESYKLGKQFTSGYNKAIDDELDKAKKKGGEYVDSFVEGVEEKGEIGSPSKVMYREGGYMVEGYVDAVFDNLDMITEASEAVIDRTVENFADMDLETQISLLPKVDMDTIDVPDIVKGIVVPTSIETTQKDANSLAGMSKKDLQNMIQEAVANIAVKATFKVEGDPYGIFKVVDEQATIYTNRTGNLAFQGS